jgi:hypothetical protein
MNVDLSAFDGRALLIVLAMLALLAWLVAADQWARHPSNTRPVDLDEQDSGHYKPRDIA